MSRDFPQGLCCLLERCFGEKISAYDVELHAGNEVGAGYVGEMIFISLTSKRTNERRHLAIKQTVAVIDKIPRPFIDLAFHNEILFYTKIWPQLSRFQETFPEVELFDKIPICYGTSSEEGSDKIALENLKFQNFSIYDKAIPFDKQHLEYILKIYGHFHALSFAYKHSHHGEFLEISKDLINGWDNITILEAFPKIKERVRNSLGPEMRGKISKKYPGYFENFSKIFSDCLKYKEEHSVILHGDCWSNNMMFKYSETKEIIDIRLLDFQITSAATPVYDLSYLFYCGSSTEDLKNYDNYLKIYHESLSESLKQYGCDSDKLYPIEILKQEWKQYSKFGFMMAILVWMGKLADYSDGTMRVNEEYENVAKSLVEHMYETETL
ncbi:hypothetical protein JTB14_029731 [Gonioctena quinquepunctata]|nr:hypothetical protein JTB14_029731 [Gonioctena quinquepunctata]